MNLIMEQKYRIQNTVLLKTSTLFFSPTNTIRTYQLPCQEVWLIVAQSHTNSSQARSMIVSLLLHSPKLPR